MPPTMRGDGFRVPKTAELVARSLRSQIIRGDLAEGQSLPPELVLTEQFGISRPTLREAFRILEAERLIEVRRGSRGGARVRSPDVQVAATHAGLLLQSRRVRLGDVYAARTVIESSAAAAVAADPPVDSVKRLRENVDATAALLDSAGSDAEGLAELAQDFHALVVEMAGNRTLELLSMMLRRIVDGANRSFVVAQGTETARARQYRSTLRAHAALGELIEGGDVHGADRLWREHLDEAERRLTAGRPSTASTLIDLLD